VPRRSVMAMSGSLPAHFRRQVVASGAWHAASIPTRMAACSSELATWAGLAHTTARLATRHRGKPPRQTHAFDVHPGRLLAAGTLLAAACFAAYWSWLGWDHTYQTDPTTGIKSGPYEPWQAAGCALTLAAVALTGGLAKQARTTLVVLPLAFTVAWSIPASTSDGNGLWPVGAILIFGGMVLGALAVALPATYLRQHLQRRNRP